MAFQSKARKKKFICDVFNNPFLVNCGSTDLNLPPTTIDDISGQKKRAFYTLDPLPTAIYFSSGNSVSTLIITSEPPKYIILGSDTPDTDHIIMIEKHNRAMEKIR